jgi:hypothetical protein
VGRVDGKVTITPRNKADAPPHKATAGWTTEIGAAQEAASKPTEIGAVSVRVDVPGADSS